MAVHILTLLASKEGEPASSEWIAASVNTNPAVIRRLLGQMSKAGLTSAQLGAGGGALLARDPRRVTLDDVYRAVDDLGEVIPIHSQPNPKCPVGRNIDAVLREKLERAERALHAELASTSIADLYSAIERATG